MVAIGKCHEAVENAKQGDNGWTATEICKLIASEFDVPADVAWTVASSIVEDATGVNVSDADGGGNGVKDLTNGKGTINDATLKKAFTKIAAVSGSADEINKEDVEGCCTALRDTTNDAGGNFVVNGVFDVGGSNKGGPQGGNGNNDDKGDKED